MSVLKIIFGRKCLSAPKIIRGEEKMVHLSLNLILEDVGIPTIVPILGTVMNILIYMKYE